MYIFLLEDMEARLTALTRKRPDAFIEWRKLYHEREPASLEVTTEVWLDHDLTEPHYKGDYSDGMTGLDFVHLMIREGWFKGVPIYVHTMNADRAQMMLDALKSAGYDARRELLVVDWDIRDDWRDSG